VLPEFNPLVGKTDFLDDKHMYYLVEYVKFLRALDSIIGTDVRNKVESVSYETFL
jgi:hypothetical protein